MVEVIKLVIFIREIFNTLSLLIENVGWRVKLRHKLNNVRQRALVGYADRRENFNCDENVDISYNKEAAIEKAYEYERGLLAACLEADEPFVTRHAPR